MTTQRNSGAKGGGFKARLLAAGCLALLAACGGAPAVSSQPAKPAKPAPQRPLFVGFYDAWDQAAVKALPEQLPKLDVFAPLWLTVRGAQGEISIEPDQGVGALLAGMKRRPEVFPLISNAHDNEWDKAATDGIILNPKTQAAFAAQLVDIARTHGFSGYVFDFENMSPAAEAAYPAFLAAVRGTLKPAGLEAWTTVSLGADQPLGPLAEAADAVVLMGYDECWTSSNPGPIAGNDWLERILAQRLTGVDPRRVIVALASYGYDWPSGGVARPVGVPEALDLAARSGAAVTRDSAARNPHFGYADPQGRRHSVWFLDAQAFAEQRQATQAWRPRGYALWRLGLEDPAIWSLPHAPRPASGPPPAASTAPLPHPCDPLHSPG